MASAAIGQVYLIPTFLDEGNLLVIPPYVLDGIRQCQAFFVENERSARRYFKQLWKEMVIENYEWHTIHKAEEDVKEIFKKLLQRGMTIGIVSEAGCPCIADPGQLLVEVAHGMSATVKPFVGPSSILLALMASGMNGQQFTFTGYLPIDENERMKALRELESDSFGKKSTQIFIETPYRNNQLLEVILKTCKPTTRLCIAVNITGASEAIITRTVGQWAKNKPDLHKQPAIFLLQAGPILF
ncbi:MAG TPA: SAM-dependent methyltransferase [Chitinophagaceae bacterium]|jgi:16S rRNA (cytidine1402-2'-O)-methyltransferase|nr:SAM-dependent methyltransferase [Chitinophagaceae bacterium]